MLHLYDCLISDWDIYILLILSSFPDKKIEIILIPLYQDLNCARVFLSNIYLRSFFMIEKYTGLLLE